LGLFIPTVYAIYIKQTVEEKNLQANNFKHIPVLLNECIEGLAIKKDGIYVDGTLRRSRA